MSTKLVLEELFEKLEGKKKKKKEVERGSALFYLFYRISKELGIQRKIEEMFKDLEKYVLGSHLRVSYPAYVATMVLLPLIIAPIISFFVFFVTFYVLYLPIPMVFLATILSFILGYAIIFALLYMVPIMMFSSRAPKLEKSLVVLYAYLAALGVSGTTYSEAIRKLYEKSEALGAEPELGEVVKRVFILGEDIIDVLKEVAQQTPHRDFSNFLIGLANVIESGIGLEKFADIGFETAMAKMEAKMKEAIGSLEIMSEMYVTGAAVMPILGLAFAVVLSTMGPAAKNFGLSLPIPPGILAGMMAFFGIPLLSVFAILMIDSTLSQIRGW